MEEVAISGTRAVDSSEFTLPVRNGVDAGGR
jgi:hypothetical protein